MNQKIEVALEFTINGHTFSLNLPFGAAFDDALSAVESFASHIGLMKDAAAAQQAATGATPPASTVAPVQTDQTAQTDQTPS